MSSLKNTAYEALMTIYKLIWDDFCSWYLEMIKPAYQRPVDRETYETRIVLLEKLGASFILLCLLLPKRYGISPGSIKARRLLCTSGCLNPLSRAPN